MRRLSAASVLLSLGIASCGGKSVDTSRVGAACHSDSDCVGTEASRCATTPLQVTPSAPMSGLMYPTPVCISDDCALPSAGVPTCGKGQGLCYQPFLNAKPYCLPLCTYEDGASPVGCFGADTCDIRYVDLSSGAPVGYGVCYFGCTRNADCGSGLVCQIDYGACVTSLNQFAAPGTPCDADQDGVLCNCLWSSDNGFRGYCSYACDVGAPNSCPTGFVCDGELPADVDGFPGFREPPGAGLRGHCLQNCQTDTDCASVNAFCYASGGMTQATCHPSPPN